MTGAGELSSSAECRGWAGGRRITPSTLLSAATCSHGAIPDFTGFKPPDRRIAPTRALTRLAQDGHHGRHKERCRVEHDVERDEDTTRASRR